MSARVKVYAECVPYADTCNQRNVVVNEAAEHVLDADEIKGVLC